MSQALVWCAFAAGMVHAGFSLYWALGGTWLLSTVGGWAVEAAEESPLQTGLLLGCVALVKAVAATVPVLLASGRLPWRRAWRAASWAGGALLLAYGAINVAVSGAVLAGVLRPDGGYDVDAMVGHALLWDPLFALWGVTLLGFLWTSRPERGGEAVPVSSPRVRPGGPAGSGCA